MARDFELVPRVGARLMEMVVVESEAQQELPDIGDTGGPG